MSTAATVARLRCALVLLVLGCGVSSPPVDAATPDASTDPTPATSAVDLLFVVDNQRSSDAQGNAVGLSQVARRLVHDLEFVDDDFDGHADLPLALSLHAAVVSGDMGVGPFTDVGEACTSAGNDGYFAGVAQGPRIGGLAVPTPTGVFELGSDGDLGAFETNIAWAVEPLTEGCDRQQVLEAGLKALSPAPDAAGRSPVSWTRDGYVPPTFFGDTVGRGGPGGTNEPFLRADSVLVVVVVTPYDDCSTPSPAIFSRGDPRYADTPLPMRCHRSPDERYPVARYVDGLLGLRRHASRLVFAVSAGMPQAAEERTPREILSDPAMQERPHPLAPTTLAPACSGFYGQAQPARRLVQVAEGLEAAGARVVTLATCYEDRLFEFEARLLDAIRLALAGHD